MTNSDQKFCQSEANSLVGTTFWQFLETQIMHKQYADKILRLLKQIKNKWRQVTSLIKNRRLKVAVPKMSSIYCIISFWDFLRLIWRTLGNYFECINFELLFFHLKYSLLFIFCSFFGPGQILTSNTFRKFF